MTAQAGDTTSLASRKAAQRKALRRARAALPAATRRCAAHAAARCLARLARAAGARHVAAYLSIKEEIDTAPLIVLLRRQGCRVYVPKIDGARLRFAPLRGALRANRFRIAEPVGGGRPPRLDLIVLPLVAFDADGRRLGMGGGYYDRLLARPRPARRPLRVGLAFAAQEVPAVPAGAGDARIDAIVTERGARRFR
jgi:5-formyltetrahydrofolate cyclo-ligase